MINVQGHLEPLESGNSFSAWPPPPETWRLSNSEVHVWRLALDQPTEVVSGLASYLTLEEQERAGKYYRKRDQKHFTVGRGLLRTILGRYLKVSPARLRFAINEYGKPFLIGEPTNVLSFNLSHSDNLALLAVTSNWSVGIDVERIREDIDYEHLAQRLFSPAEAEEWHGLPPQRRPEAFFQWWTLKEAYIKGQGTGMSLDLQSFDVTLLPPGLRATKPALAETNFWQIRTLSPAPGYVAAVAVRGRNWSLRCWSWADEQTVELCK